MPVMNDGGAGGRARHGDGDKRLAVHLPLPLRVLPHSPFTPLPLQVLPCSPPPSCHLSGSSPAPQPLPAALHTRECGLQLCRNRVVHSHKAWQPWCKEHSITVWQGERVPGVVQGVCSGYGTQLCRRLTHGCRVGHGMGRGPGAWHRVHVGVLCMAARCGTGSDHSEGSTCWLRPHGVGSGPGV